jgi:CDP-diacylglycerol--glycerol-3-phosphate 3-phosphatidyltransferase
VKRVQPLVGIFSRWGLSPNAFTVTGLIVSAFAAIAFTTGSLRLGGVLILLGGFCDMIDGSLARTSGRTSRFGALLDSTVDRYAEFIMFLGIGAHFVLLQDYVTALGTFFALCGSVMVSYTRARTEGLGMDGKVGIMQRPERIVFIGTAALIHPLLLIFVIWMVAVFANFTAVQRLRHAYRQDTFETGETGTESDTAPLKQRPRLKEAKHSR